MWWWGNGGGDWCALKSFFGYMSLGIGLLLTYFAYITFASMALRFGMEEESLSFLAHEGMIRYAFMTDDDGVHRIVMHDSMLDTF
jgi:hypothetical protein